MYEHAERADGVRALVDRIWPRGLSKEKADLDDWARGVAPSSQLRRWYGHRADRFPEFARRYRQELATPAGREALGELLELAGDRKLTLLTATRDLDHSHAVVLADELRRFEYPESG